MTAFITRFAPSPTGLLHLGHAYSALVAFDAARAASGRFLLRIEDIDTGRCRPEFEDAILDDLAWLGLKWETPVRRQSEHFPDYAAALQKLINANLVYRCFKTRREIAEDIARAPHGPGEGPDGAVYLGPSEPMSAEEEAERVAAGEAFAWRLSLARAREHLGDVWPRLSFVEEGDGAAVVVMAEPARLGDAILARKDTPVSYHLAVTHDDALQGVTHVIRGEDLRDATHLHVLLQALLGWPTPVYCHHQLILDAKGKRFAKRDQAATLAALREAGATPGDVRATLGLA